MLTYVIDVARGGLDPVPLLDFAVYVAFFPYLLAGPIARAAEFLPQLRGPRDPRSVDAARAFRLIVGGLAKKVLIADYLATHLVNGLFTAPDQYSSWETLVGIYAYAVQIYCDFSGYTDIALGVALLLGFELPENFAAPYTARSVREFWRRWHITLSTWLRDYLYIPLGGNRGGRRKTTRNLMLTMLLGGLWHGAAWTYVLWGGLHGVALVVEHGARDRRRRAGLPEPGATAWGRARAVARRLQLRRLRLGLLQGRLHRQRRGRPRPARHRSGQRRQRGHPVAAGARRASASPCSSCRARLTERFDAGLSRAGWVVQGLCLAGGALPHRLPRPAGRGRVHLLRVLTWRRDDVSETETSVDAGTAGGGRNAGRAGRRRRRATAGAALAAMLLGFFLAGLLDAAALRRDAESLPIGARRTALLWLVRPMTALSGAVGLDEAAVALDRALGRDDGVHHARRDLAGKDDPPIWPRAVTARKPLRLYIAGDSMAGQFGGPLAAMAETDGLVRDARRLPREQRTEPTGLLRLAAAPHRRGLRLPRGGDRLSRRRQRRPGRRVGRTRARRSARGRGSTSTTCAWRRPWRSPPPAAVASTGSASRSCATAAYGERMAMLNDVYEKEAALHEGVTYVDTWDLMAGKDGEYAAYLRGPDGDLERVRQADGVHLTRAGGDRMAARVLEVIRDDWDMGGGSP